MKKNYIILVLLMLVAGLQTAQAQYGIRIWKNGSYEQKKTENVDSQKKQRTRPLLGSTAPMSLSAKRVW